MKSFQLIKLPIDPILPELVSYLETNRSGILHATPGSGKTTRVPPALLRSRFVGPDQEVWVLEPRRLAAKYAAYRVAEELGEPVGKTVGYHFRFEKVAGPSTRLHFLTEGMLIRRLIGDPQLKKVAAVVLDEFHERHLHGDIALAYLARLQATTRPDLRLVVMSATIDAEAVAGFLGSAERKCGIFKVDAPVFPITTHHLPSPPAKSLDVTVRDAVVRALDEEKAGRQRGDILVFLPGMADIRRAEERLRETFPRPDSEPLILPLHGELSREEQDRAIQKGQRQKVILSTNVAETSLTIEGLTTVIDSGLHRQASYSWWSGVPSLHTRPISRASAIQRAGRAGRTAPGRCFRLYTQGDFSSRPPFEVPEIQRADLCQTLLELKSLGIEDLASFPWFEPPSPRSLLSAQELLYRLGALDHPSGQSKLTSLGARMVQIPAHPRISRMLIEAEKWGVLDRAATLAALINEGGLDRGSAGEVSDALEMIPSAERDGLIRRAKSHLLSSFSAKAAEPSAKKPGGTAESALRFSILTGFPDRVARKRNGSLLFSSGGSTSIIEKGVLTEGDTFVTLDIQEQKHLGQARAQLKVRSVCLIQPEWLFDLEPAGVEEKEEILWDAERERIRSVSRMCYGELTLLEEEGAPTDEDAAARALLRATLGIDAARAAEMKPEDWVHALSKLADTEQVESAIARVGLVAQYLPSLLPEPSWHRLISQGILSLFHGKSRLSELREIDWENSLFFTLFPESTSLIDSQLPTHVSLNPKRRVRIHYKLGQPPWIESRLQDFFGLKRGPAILNGKLPLTLHLLAPNQRAVQVTTDLTGFWERTYPELRTALSRRYPRHAWPENPLELVSSDS